MQKATLSILEKKNGKIPKTKSPVKSSPFLESHNSSSDSELEGKVKLQTDAMEGVSSPAGQTASTSNTVASTGNAQLPVEQNNMHFHW